MAVDELSPEEKELDDLQAELRELLVVGEDELGAEMLDDGLPGRDVAVHGKQLGQQPRLAADDARREDTVFGCRSEDVWFDGEKSEVESVLDDIRALCRYDSFNGSERVVFDNGDSEIDGAAESLLGLKKKVNYRPAPREFAEGFGDAPSKVRVQGAEPAIDLSGALRRPILASPKEQHCFSGPTESIVGKSMSHLSAPETVNSEVLAVNRWGTLVVRSTVVFGLLAGCVSVAIAALLWGQKPAIMASGLPAMSGVEFEGDLFRAAEQTVRDFLRSSSSEERQAHVMRAPEFLLHESSAGPFPAGALHKVLRKDLVMLGDRNHFVLQAEDFLGDRRLFFVDVSSDSPQLDWEATFGVDEMSFEQFRDDRPTESKLMRVLIEPGDYYNFAYSDRKKYVSYLVRDHTGSQPLAVYVERDSQVHTTLSTLFRVESLKKPKLAQVTSSASGLVKPLGRRVTLSLGFEDRGSDSEQAIVTKWFAEDWVYHTKGKALPNEQKLAMADR